MAIGIILLFVGVTIAPAINAQDNDKSILTDSIPITVLEYKSDGTVERTVVKMSPEQADSFHEEMRKSQDLDIRLSIYKKYNLIPQDVTVDSLREGMEKRAQNMGLTTEILKARNPNKKVTCNLKYHGIVYLNLMCAISGYGKYIVLPIGTSTFLYALLLKKGNDLGNGDEFHIPCKDLRDSLFGGIDFTTEMGLLPNYRIAHIGFVRLIGFVGYLSTYIDDEGPYPRQFFAFSGCTIIINTIGLPGTVIPQ